VRMRLPFSDTFGTNKTLGIQMTPGSLGAVLVHHAMRGPEVEKAAFFEPEEGRDLGADLAEFLEGEGLDTALVVTSLPSSAASLREVDVTIKGVKKIRRIIKYQVEPYIPFPVEDSVVDFLPGTGNGHVLTAAVEKQKISEHLDVLRDAGLDPDRVTLDDFAVNALYRRLSGEEEDGPVALLRMGPGRDGLQILEGSRIRLIRSIPEGGEGVRALIETLHLDAIEHPENPVKKVLVTGPGSGRENVAEELNKALGIPVEVWRPFSGLKVPKNTLDAEVEAKLTVPLGLAVSGAPSRVEEFNLRKEEFRKKTHSNVRNQLWIAILGLVILGAITTFSIQRKTGELEARADEIRTEMNGILMDTFPEIPQVIPGREFYQMEQKINEQKAQFGWLTSLTSDRTVLDVLLALTGSLAGHQGVTVDNISVDDREIHLDGRAPSFQTVDKVKESLEKDVSFSRVRLLSAKSDKGEGSVRFSFVLEGAQ